MIVDDTSWFLIHNMIIVIKIHQSYYDYSSCIILYTYDMIICVCEFYVKKIDCWNSPNIFEEMPCQAPIHRSDASKAFSTCLGAPTMFITFTQSMVDMAQLGTAWTIQIGWWLSQPTPLKDLISSVGIMTFPIYINGQS